MPTRIVETFESAAAEVVRRYVEVLQRSGAGCGAACLSVAGGMASFAGADSPLTGVKGLQPHVSFEQIGLIEEHFRLHQEATVTLELAPWIPGRLLRWLEERGYRVSTEELVVCLDLEALGSLENAVAQASMPVSSISDRDAFVDVMIPSFGVPDEDRWRQLFSLFFELPDSLSLGVYTDNLLAAAAHLLLLGDVAILGCDGTLPAYRGHGMQAALIIHRLRRAVESGARWAVAEVATGSGSMRNYLRQGFTVAYPRRHWTRQLDVAE